MSLRQRVNDELKQAMKAADKLKVSTLRLVNAAIKERDIENRTAGPDSGVGEAQILEVLNKMIKQRQDSLAAYEQAGRQDLAEKERGEIAIIRYLHARNGGRGRDRGGHRRGDRGNRRRERQGHGQGDGPFEGALCRADGFWPRRRRRQNQAPGLK